MYKIFSFLILSLFLIGCVSVEKHNAQISKTHTPSELKLDTDLAYQKLQKLHPDLYLYISKNDLDNKFSKVKNSINKPLSSRSFYKLLTPVITSIGQGHTSLNPPYKKQTKKNIKSKGKRKDPFDLLDFKKVTDKIFITKNFSKDSTILVKSELLSINNKTTKELINSFKELHTGDGYNKTFVPEFTSKYIGYFYNKTHGLKDSLQLKLKFKDSIYNKYIFAFDKKTKKDSTKNKTKKKPKKKLTKAEKKIAKKKRKAREQWEKNHGYNKLTKELYRNFKFINSVKNPIAYLHIRGFQNGSYEDFYEDTFRKIDSAKTTNLIIDLRDNRGGRLSEIAHIYTYLTNKEHYFTKTAKMTNASNWMRNIYRNNSILSKSIHTIMFPFYKIKQIIRVKYKNGDPYFKFNSSKLNEPSKEHNYKGKIYVLTNGISFSASSVLSNNLKANNRAFFVGDETGGAYNSTVAGQFATVELPNSKLNLNFGLLQIETLNREEPDGYGVKPDKYIKVTTLETDEQLDWILNDINNQK